MPPFTTLALRLTLAALSAYANHRFIDLPNTAALMLLSLLLIVGSHFGLPFQNILEDLLKQVDLARPCSAVC